MFGQGEYNVNWYGQTAASVKFSGLRTGTNQAVDYFDLMNIIVFGT
jgi:hypothetical protein